MSEENKTNKTQFWANLGEGLGIMFICMGIGTCSVGVGTCSALEKGYIRINQQKYENITNPTTDN